MIARVVDAVAGLASALRASLEPSPEWMLRRSRRLDMRANRRLARARAAAARGNWKRAERLLDASENDEEAAKLLREDAQAMRGEK